MRKLILYTAATLDGFIAGPNGELDWLEQPSTANDFAAGDPEQSDYGFSALFDSVDTTLQGTATYEFAAGVTEDPYPGKINYVFTRRSPTPSDTNVWRFITGDIVTFVRDLKEQPGSGIWLVGGGQINTVMLNAGLIDEIIVTFVPIVLGEGIPLFAPGADRTEFQTTSSESFPSGLVQWTMSKA
jgi:dihydrofolate reductase